MGIDQPSKRRNPAKNREGQGEEGEVGCAHGRISANLEGLVRGHGNVNKPSLLSLSHTHSLQYSHPHRPHCTSYSVHRLTRLRIILIEGRIKRCYWLGIVRQSCAPDLSADLVVWVYGGCYGNDAGIQPQQKDKLTEGENKSAAGESPAELSFSKMGQS